MSKALDAKYLRLQRDRLLAEQGGRCVYCYTPLICSTATLEHKHPRSRGGTDHPSNLAVSCMHCNKTKATRSHPQFQKAIKTGAGNIYLQQRYHIRKINLAADRACKRILAMVG